MLERSTTLAERLSRPANPERIGEWIGRESTRVRTTSKQSGGPRRQHKPQRNSRKTNLTLCCHHSTHWNARQHPDVNTHGLRER